MNSKHICLRGLFILIGSSLLIFSCRESLDHRILRETESFNKRNCPKRLDDFVRLDSISYVVHENIPNEYKYCHSVECDTMQIQILHEHEEIMKSEILKRIRNAQDLRLIKDAGITISYLFYKSDTQDTIFYFKYPMESYLK